MEKLNLVEILKDCPKGTKLYSPALGECALEGVNDNNDYPIKVTYKIINNDTRFDYFTKYGYLLINKPDAECMLFPSKEQRDWNKWQRPFVDGDVVTCENQIAIFKKYISDYSGLAECYVVLDNNLEMDIDGHYYVTDLATEKEKAKLFKALEDNGYKWNADEKKLEKIAPKFNDKDKIHTWTIQDAKDGDVLAINWYEGYDYWEKIVIFKKYHNEGANSPCVEGYGNTFKNRKLAFHEEVPRFSKTWTSCLEPANKEQRDLLFQTIKEAGYRWNTETKILEKLIVPKFKVGDSIQSKTDNNDKFTITNIDNDKFYYGCRKRYEFMIPVVKQDNWELVPNKFDISTLIPYESKVLIRSTIGGYWQPAFWGAYIIDTSDGLHHHDYLTTRGFTPYCIPYDGNEHLIGKTDDCCDFYKTWEE